MGRRVLGIVLFVLLVVALLAPVYNVFQPGEQTTLFTDTEFQVSAIAFVAGLFVAVALLLAVWVGWDSGGVGTVPRMTLAPAVGGVAGNSGSTDGGPPRVAQLRI
jgi:hypothetical protein